MDRVLLLSFLVTAILSGVYAGLAMGSSYAGFAVFFGLKCLFFAGALLKEVG